MMLCTLLVVQEGGSSGEQQGLTCCEDVDQSREAQPSSDGWGTGLYPVVWGGGRRRGTAEGVTLLWTGEGSRGVKDYLFSLVCIMVQGVVSISICYHSQHPSCSRDQSKWKKKLFQVVMKKMLHLCL